MHLLSQLIMIFSFDSSHYRPTSDVGKRLVAHELTHVIQQERGKDSHPLPVPGGGLEQEANRVASSIDIEKPIEVFGVSAKAIARQPTTPSTPDTKKMYQYTDKDGKVITLDEEQYTRGSETSKTQLGTRFQVSRRSINWWHAKSSKFFG